MVAKGNQPPVSDEPARAAHARAPYRAVPHSLIRVNNVPFVALRAPGATEAMGAIERLAALRRWLREHREPLCDTLYQAIARDPGNRAMRPLIDLKRDIHKDRDSKVQAEVALGLCDDDGVREWFRARAEAAAIEAAVAGGHDERLGAERALVQQLLVHPDFLRATVVSSLDLQESIDGYVKSPVAAHGKRQRKTEQSLLSYLLRAMTRTSPYSYYTSVAYAHWNDADAAPPPWSLSPERARLVEPNHVLIRRIVLAVVTHPEVREQVRYRVCPDARVEGNAIAFSVLRDDPANQPRAFQVRQFLGRVPATPALVAVLQLLRSMGPSVYTGMVAEIAAKLRGASEAQVRPILDQMIAAGLLVPVIPIAENAPDITAEAAAFLRTMPARLSQQVAEALEEKGRLVRGFPAEDPSERRDSLKALQAVSGRAAALLDGTIPKGTPILYEDTGIPGTFRADPALWAEVWDDLAALGSFIELVDTNTVLPALVRDTFVERHGVGGRCAYLDFTDTTTAIYERWFQISVADQLPAELAARYPSLQAKLDLRRQVGRQLGEQWHGEEELEIGRDLLDSISAAMPAQSGFDWASYSMFVQPEIEAGKIERVFVNPIYQGLGMFFSRFLPMLGEDALATVRANVRDFFPEDWLVVGARPVAGFNANLHPPLTPLELDLELDGEPAGDIKLSDLALVHDPDTDTVQLVHARTGQRTVVLYQGFLIPALLPSKWSLVQALGSGNVHGSALSMQSRATRPDRPRLRHGKVVISRRTWRYPVASVPQPGPGESEAQYFTRVNLWRIEQGIPSEVFLHVQPGPAAPASAPVPAAAPASAPKTGDWWKQLGWTREKPQYVDFESAVVVRFFARWLKRRGEGDRLSFTETRPALPRSLIRGADGPHATEVIVEINRPPGRPPRPRGGAA